MFVPLMQGKVKDAGMLASQWGLWESEVKPSAIGYLGTTAGISGDGHFVALARFASQEEARANSNRPEQDEWWKQTAKCFDGEVSFAEGTDVAANLEGCKEAGFVQMIRGHADDGEALRAVWSELDARVRAARKDVIGSLFLMLEGGDFVQAAYFTSEDDARMGEISGDYEPLFEEFERLTTNLEFLDLPEPWLSSA